MPADGRTDSRPDAARCVPTQGRQDMLQDLAAYLDGVNPRFMPNTPKTKGRGDTHGRRRRRNRPQELAASRVLCRPAYPAVEF